MNANRLANDFAKNPIAAVEAEITAYGAQFAKACGASREAQEFNREAIEEYIDWASFDSLPRGHNIDPVACFQRGYDSVLNDC